MTTIEKYFYGIAMYLILLFLFLKTSLWLVPYVSLLLIGCTFVGALVWIVAKKVNAISILTIVSIAVLGTGSMTINFQGRVTQERANQLLVIIKKYRYDNGSYPSNLNELMPAYLDNIPESAYGFFDDEEITYSHNDKYFFLSYYAPFGVEATYSSQHNKWSYDD